MRHVRNIVGIVFCASLVLLFVVYVEVDLVLNPRINPVPGIKLSEWLDSFRTWSTLIVVVSAAGGLAWYMAGQWVFRHDHHGGFNKRPLWFLFMVPSVIALVAGSILMLDVTRGSWIAHAFNLVNGIGTYYLTTVLFSPSSLKYIPPLSSLLRRW